MKTATLHPCITTALITVAMSFTVMAQTPPTVDPSKVESGFTAGGRYYYNLKDGTESRGSIFNDVDSKTGSGVIFTIPDHGDMTTTLVSPGLSVTY